MSSWWQHLGFILTFSLETELIKRDEISFHAPGCSVPALHKPQPYSSLWLRLLALHVEVGVETNATE